MTSALVLATVMASSLSATAASQRPIHYESFEKDGAYYHCVVADLSESEVSAQAQLASRLTPPWHLIADTQPAAAITGTFFAWENERPIAEVLIDGEVRNAGRRGSIVAVDWFGKVHIFDAKFGEIVDWFPYRWAIRGNVRVVKDGQVKPNPKAQRFTDPRIWGRAKRTAIGTRPDGTLVLMATPNAVTLGQLGWALVSRGVTNAVSLDGGGSTMLYYRGEMVIRTSRPLCNMFILHERSPFDSKFRALFNGQ
jgi:hypothetical protein